MEIINELIKTRDQTLPYFNLEVKYLQKTYTLGKWTIKEILHHLADAETVLYERIRRGIAEKNVVVQDFDQDAWCKNLDYQEQDLALDKAIYLATRNGVISLTERYYTLYGSNSFTHSVSGLRTVKEEINKVAWHNTHHLKHIKTALKEA